MNRFQRARRDHQTEVAEDYVELIARLIEEQGEARSSELASRLGVSPATVGQTLQRLQKEGLVTSEPYRSIFLTEKGKEMAAFSQERHETVLSFLLAIGVDRKTAEHDSEGMEHHVSAETLAALKRFLDQT